MRLSDTKGDSNMGVNGFSGMANSAGSSNGCSRGEVWTRRRRLTRSDMILVAVEKIGGLFLNHGQGKWECDQGLLAWPCRK